MRSRILWLIGVVVAVLIGTLIPVLINHSYYFVDDTQSGAFGQWWKIGDRLLSWDWSFVNPTVWQSGNYLAEGAWGLFSPLLWIVGLGSHLASSAVVYVTIVKVSCFELAALGTWLLARTFKASAGWASVAAVGVVLTGFSLYIDGPSWVNGLMAWAVWPLAWALTRRAVFEQRSALLAALSGVAVVGIGYVHATIMLAVTLIATIIEAYARRLPGTVVRSWALSLLAGLFAIIVHLPSVLIAPVTGRATGIGNTGLLTVNLSGLAASSVAGGSPEMNFFGALFPGVPLLYVAWFLPFGAFIVWKRFIPFLRQNASLILVFAVALVAVVVLPSDFGPLRFPVRLMPYVSVGAIVIVAVGLSVARAVEVSRKRFAMGAVLIIAAALIALGASPHYWKVILAATVVAIVATWLAYRALSSQGLPRWLGGGIRIVREPRSLVSLVAVGVVLVSVFLVIPQHIAHPRSPLRDYGVPSAVPDLQKPLADSQGDVFVVGAMDDGVNHPAVWKETLVGNLFYLTKANVQNAYSSVYYPGYQNNVCMEYNGFTCGDIYTRLFQKQRQTGLQLATLMGVSTVQVIKAQVPKAIWEHVPAGWHLVSDTANTRLIERNRVIAGAGGVVWSSSGMKITKLREDAMGVSFRVDDVPPDGGSVAISRINWPGYSASNADIGKTAIDDFLMNVHVDSSAKGKVVTVSYSSPGWELQALAGVLWMVIVAMWVLARRFRGVASSNRVLRHLVASTEAELSHDESQVSANA